MLNFVKNKRNKSGLKVGKTRAKVKKWMFLKLVKSQKTGILVDFARFCPVSAHFLPTFENAKNVEFTRFVEVFAHFPTFFSYFV